MLFLYGLSTFLERHEDYCHRTDMESVLNRLRPIPNLRIMNFGARSRTPLFWLMNLLCAHENFEGNRQSSYASKQVPLRVAWVCQGAEMKRPMYCACRDMTLPVWVWRDGNY